MSGRHAALVPLRQQIRPRRGFMRRHKVLSTIGVAWVLFAVVSGIAAGVTEGVGMGLQIFGACFGTPLFFIALVGVPLGLYCWICKKVTDRFPRATAVVLSYGAGRAAAQGQVARAALYGVGAYQSAEVAAQRAGQQWVGVSVPTQGGHWSPSPELIAGALGAVSGVGADLRSVRKD